MVFSSYSYVIESLIYVLTSAGYNIFIHLTNKAFSPTHHVVVDGFNPMIMMLVCLLLRKKNFQYGCK